MKRNKFWMILGGFSLILTLSLSLLAGDAEAQAQKAGAEDYLGICHQPRTGSQHLDLLPLSPFSKAPGEKLGRTARTGHENGIVPGE